MKGIDRLKAGRLNYIGYEVQPDGSWVITLFKRGEGKVYRFCVKDLYGKNEKVLWEGEPPQPKPEKEKKAK